MDNFENNERSATDFSARISEERDKKYKKIDKMTEKERESYYAQKISDVSGYKDIPGVKIVTVKAKDLKGGQK